LSLPSGATPDDHRRVKRTFLQKITRARKKLGCVVELHATLDITDQGNAHWDVVAYSDLSQTKMHALIGESWKGSGGLRFSLVPIQAVEVETAAKYQSKAESERRDRDHYRSLPMSRSAGGLQVTWRTVGFWGQGGQEAAWKELVALWFPTPELPTGSNELVVNLASRPDPNSTPQTEGQRLL